jgi:hypothetical protein
LKEYQDVFTKDSKDLKGLVEEMGEMKNALICGANLINKRTYKLAYKYKEIIQHEIKNMLVLGIFCPI